MPIAIVLTLLFAAATSALGAVRQWRLVRRYPLYRRRNRLGAVIGAVMALWFTLAALWEFGHS